MCKLSYSALLNARTTKLIWTFGNPFTYDVILCPTLAFTLATDELAYSSLAWGPQFSHMNAYAAQQHVNAALPLVGSSPLDGKRHLRSHFNKFVSCSVSQSAKCESSSFDSQPRSRPVNVWRFWKQPSWTFVYFQSCKDRCVWLCVCVCVKREREREREQERERARESTCLSINVYIWYITVCTCVYFMCSDGNHCFEHLRLRLKPGLIVVPIRTAGQQGLLLHLKTVQSFHSAAHRHGTVGGNTAHRKLGMFDFRVTLEEVWLKKKILQKWY